MLDKLWSTVEKSDNPSVHAEILAMTYFNAPSDDLTDIIEAFNSWAISDFEEVLDEVLSMPPLEGDSLKEFRFGKTNFVSRLMFNEANYMTDLPSLFWKRPITNKKKFF